MAWILTADTGGSKTALQVRDSATDTLLFHTRVEIGFGKDVESPEILPELKALLQDITAQYPIDAAAVNLGGKNKAQITATFRAAFAEIPLAVCRESEGDAACAFGEAVGAQVILLCGTGTLGVGISPTGTKTVCGGWGMNIGDGGSGYDIGLSAIRHSLAALDGLAPLSMLAQKITGQDAPFGAVDDFVVICRQRDAVRGCIFPPERNRIAAYTRLTAECAAQGDTAALDIFTEAGEKLAQLALAVAAKVDMGAAGKIALTGGLLHTAAFWRESFQQRVTAKMPRAEFLYKPDGLSDGIYQIGKKLIS